VKTMRIAIDIDGPVARFNDTFIPFCNEQFNLQNKPEDITHYDYISSPNIQITAAQLKKAFEVFTEENGWYWPYPEKDVQQFLQKISYTSEVTYITGRPRYTSAQTIAWLSNWDLAFGDILFVHSSEKAKVAKALGCVYAVEDHPETCKDYANNGIKCFVWDMPFNQSVNGNNLVRVKNWDMVYNYLHDDMDEILKGK